MIQSAQQEPVAGDWSRLRDHLAEDGADVIARHDNAIQAIIGSSDTRRPYPPDDPGLQRSAAEAGYEVVCGIEKAAKIFLRRAEQRTKPSWMR